MVNLVLSGVLLVLGITVAVMFNSDFFVKGTGKLLGSIPKTRAIVTPAIGYPLNKRFRTGLTVSMFSLIMFIVTLFSIFFSVFTPDLETQGGGMDIIATTTLPVNDIYNVSFGTTGDNATNVTGDLPLVKYDNLTKKVDWVASLYLYGYWGDLLVNDKAYPVYQAPYHQIYGIDATFAEHTQFSMKRMAKEYSTDREVWEAIATTPGLCVIDTGTTGENYGIPDPMGPGDIVSFPKDQASSQAKFKVIGVVDEMILGGVFMGKPSMAENFTQVKGDTLFIMGVNKGQDIKDVAKGLETDFRAVGMNAIEVKATLVELNKALQQMFQMFEIFLALGLIIAVASLAVLAVRAVIERRREIGIMRAIGYKRSMIMGTFMTEILFVTSLGVLIGLAAGLIAGYGIWLTQMKSLGVAFNVPWSHVGLIIGLTYMFAIIFTILPSYRASRIPPAEAVRHTE
jgi:putative ABC transport system permease protein